MSDTGKRPEEERDEIGTLLGLAGKRPPVPRERAARVRRAAHAAWREQVQRRRTREWVLLAAAVATAASLLWAIWITSEHEIPTVAPPPSMRVERVVGQAWVRGPGDTTAARRELRAGDDVSAAAGIGTTEGGAVALRLGSGHSLRLGEATRVWLQPDGSLALEQGRLYVDSGPTEPRTRLTIRTPLGELHEIGTQFGTRLDGDSLRVRLREGSVELQRGEEVFDVSVGHELVVAADGTTSRRAIPLYGPDWEWLTAVTPMLEIEGRSAREFLEWVARERGWRLVFADALLARSAEEIRLDGSIAGLTVDQALDAVLPTCRMTSRVEAGVLRVYPDDDTP